MEDLTHTQPPGRTAHRRRVPPREAGTQRVSETLSLPEPATPGGDSHRRTDAAASRGPAPERVPPG